MKELTVMLVTEETMYNKIVNVTKRLLKSHDKICYVLLKNQLSSVKEMLSNEKVPVSKMFFVDCLSAHFSARPNEKNCVFLDGPNLENLKDELLNAIEKKSCEVIIIDNLSSLLAYYPNCSIQSFINEIKQKCNTEKILFMQSNEIAPEDTLKLLYDLTMYADRIVKPEPS